VSVEVPDPMSLDGYLDNDQYNLDQIRTRLPHFRELMPRVHRLYEVSRSLIPRDSQPVYGRCLLLCHKSFLAAAAAIGRRHPDDAAATTRRAIETITLALAAKLDPANLDKWQQTEARLKRWAERHAGRRPPRISVRYSKEVHEHALLQKLKTYEGILSDSFVHFTPESVVMQAFREATEGTKMTLELPYLVTDQKIIEQQLIFLADIHHRIIGILDECYDRRFSADTAWQEASTQLSREGQRASDHYLATRTTKPEEGSA
jgi:hypothetical protein